MQLTVWIDGGSRGNPGPAAAGVVIDDADGKPLYRAGVFLGRATSNVAEYSALVHALTTSLALGASKLDIHADSELLVNQINGKYKVKSPALRPLYVQATELLDQLGQWKCQHVYRDGNQVADSLANLAMDEGRDVIQIDRRDNDHSSPPLAQHNLLEELDLAGASQQSQDLLNADHARVVLLRMASGHRIKPHLSKSPLTFQVISGQIIFTVGDDVRELRTGDWIAVPLGTVHSVAAESDSAVLVTLFRCA